MIIPVFSTEFVRKPKNAAEWIEDQKLPEDMFTEEEKKIMDKVFQKAYDFFFRTIN